MSDKPGQTSPNPKRAKSATKPEVLRIEGIGWEDTVKKSFTKKKPATGWPK